MRIKKLFAGILAGAMVVGCMVMPSSAATGSITEGSFSGNLAFNGFTAGYAGGWVGVQASAGSTTLTATVQDIMDVNSITDIDDFGGFIFQVWNSAEGDVYECTLTYNGNVVYDDTYTQGENDWNITTLAGTNSWGSYTFDESDEIVATINVVTYTATTLYEIDSDIVDNYSSYTVTVETSDGLTGSVTGNTYYIDSYSGTYYIGVDVSDMPGDETVIITDVKFE